VASSMFFIWKRGREDKEKEKVDIYRTNERRKRAYSASAFGYPGKQGSSQFRSGSQPYADKYRHSPYIYKSSSPVLASQEAVRLNADYQGYFAMESNIPAVLRSINESKMSVIARQALKRNNFHIQGWRVRKLDGGIGNPVSVGLYRFEGIGVDRNEWLDWSIILKVIQSPGNLGYVNMGEGEDQTHWNYWKRELLLYQSGWLETLPEGITAPRCYDAMEMPGNLAGLWLEDISDSFSGSWPLYRYALTARHLGRLNGIYINRRELPTFPWFSSQRTRQWLNMIPWKDFPWDHPHVRQNFPHSGDNSFRRLLDEHEQILARLNQLPQTVSHGDTYPTNFRSRRVIRSQEQTVAMDWALAGIAPLGDDLGQLVYGTSMNLRSYKLHDISQMLFTSYINGLQDSGCRIDPQVVRFGYAASAAFRVGLFKLSMMREEIEKENDHPHNGNNPVAVNDPYEAVMADEAFRLLDSI
jgi:hypothetical protein